MKVVLYGVEGCPRCWSLSRMMEKNHIEYTKVSDVDTITKVKKLDNIPALEVDGQIMYMQEAVRWLARYNKKE